MEDILEEVQLRHSKQQDLVVFGMPPQPATLEKDAASAADAAEVQLEFGSALERCIIFCYHFAFSMEWNEESTLLLIETYRNYEILWDTKHPLYYNKIRKNDAWEEVAKQLGTTDEACKKKMTSVLAALRREKSKIKKSEGTGKGRDDIYESSWFAFKSLIFLWDKHNVRNTQSTIDKEADAQEISDAVALADSQESVPETTLTSTPKTNTAERNTRKKRHGTEERLEEAFQILKQASAKPNEEPNEHDLFGKLVAKKMQRYALNTQCLVQEEIMSILFRADRTLYKQNEQYYCSSSNSNTQCLVQEEIMSILFRADRTLYKQNEQYYCSSSNSTRNIPFTITSLENPDRTLYKQNEQYYCSSSNSTRNIPFTITSLENQ
ncbi:Alcohol dehydrogenase transcription factor Myb/SANT-like [Popillia japonica]|uniref:Alcohol dehydrogenase transcription factor Myb/SANT-like n=1 Tax=Popillia japonica TaxID=7064 RepID=A0AAW1J1Q7_POPJA